MKEISREELREYYIVQDHTFEETRKHFQVGKKYLNKHLNLYRLYKNFRDERVFTKQEYKLEKPESSIISYRIKDND